MQEPSQLALASPEFLQITSAPSCSRPEQAVHTAPSATWPHSVRQSVLAGCSAALTAAARLSQQAFHTSQQLPQNLLPTSHSLSGFISAMVATVGCDRRPGTCVGFGLQHRHVHICHHLGECLACSCVHPLYTTPSQKSNKASHLSPAKPRLEHLNVAPTCLSLTLHRPKAGHMQRGGGSADSTDTRVPRCIHLLKAAIKCLTSHAFVAWAAEEISSHTVDPDTSTKDRVKPRPSAPFLVGGVRLPVLCVCVCVCVCMCGKGRKGHPHLAWILQSRTLEQDLLSYI